jgi:2-amino-4-hydroxy-6-hydroxymethyldihydropteridine diphosphokinase
MDEQCTVYLGLGSNKDDKEKNLRKAAALLSRHQCIEVTKISSVYETAPYGEVNQDNFFNAAVEIRTTFKPEELLVFIKEIEKKIGREKTIKWGPREIDIDILFYNHLIYNTEFLTIPHEGVTERAFVLIPLTEIAPDFVHPSLNIKLKNIKVNQPENIIRKLKINLLRSD